MARRGLHLLGGVDLAPAQLAALDRPLTTDEQRRVDAWQQSPDFGKDISTPTGPAPHTTVQSANTTVLPTEYVTRKILPPVVDPYPAPPAAAPPPDEWPWWQKAFVGVVVAVGVGGLYRAARGVRWRAL